MSKASAFIAMVVTVLLALGSWLALRPSAVKTVPVPLVGVDLTEAAAIRFTSSDGVLVLRRGPLAEQWLLERGASNDANSAAWPVDPTRVRALMRLVMDLRADGPAESDAAGSSVRVVFEDASGKPAAELSVSGQSLGGMAAARTAFGTARIEDRFAAMFREESLMNWRQAVAFVRTPSPATRLMCRSRDDVNAVEHTVEVRRAGSGWALMEPISTDAEPADAAALARAMETVQFVDLIDESTEPAVLGLGTPLRVYQMESILVGSEQAPDRRSLVQTLEVGGPAPASGTRFARVSAVLTGTGIADAERVWGPQIGILDATTIAALRVTPGQLIARRAVRLPAADITAISGTVNPAPPGSGSASHEMRFEREGSAWRGVHAVTASRLDRLVHVLTQTPAESALVRGLTDQPIGPSAMVTMFERRGNAVANLSIWSEAGASGDATGTAAQERLVVADEKVVRRFAFEDPAALIEMFRSGVGAATVPERR